ncbi:MAG TPA: class I SAM-dependent methyltransferase [Thermoanaerobaculia bacterium]|nr:class I SAM-dependent methyltransferase [Thermoanaerobaculia bacterium]
MVERAGDDWAGGALDPLPNVYARQLTPLEIAEGKHRDLVGGLWDLAGPQQLRFLVARGLRPWMRLLDLGCGCLRGGLPLVQFIDPGRYYGIDVNASLLAAGLLEVEVAGLADRLPPGNLLRSDALEGWRFGVDFEVVLAHSLFTHLPPAWLRRCLGEMERYVPPGGRFFATYFEWPEGLPAEDPLEHQPGGIVSFADRDPFHYRVEDLRRCAAGLPWELEVIGEWGHPRDQRMALFTRIR